MTDQDDDFSRRGFLKALGACLALAGLDGCTRMPAEKILPFVYQPPELTPGVAVHYATSMVLDGYATGLVVETHEGRPTKIEGNPDHPASLGAAGVFEQASLLQLYDPYRATRLRSGTAPMTWDAFVASVAPSILRQRVGAQGTGLALLLEPSSSPLIADLLTRLQELYPAMGVHYYAPLRSHAASGAIGNTVIPQYDIRAANVVLSIDADFLANTPLHLRYAREFADRRRQPLQGMNRLYVVEPGFTVTGAAADHRLRCRPTAIVPMLTDLLATITSANVIPLAAGTGSAELSAEVPEVSRAWLSAVADDLKQNAGESIVIAGERLSPQAHALVGAINDALGNTGHTVRYTPSPLLGAGQATTTLASLVHTMQSGTIDTLVCLGGNPSYATPASMQFSRLLRAIPNSIYLGLYENETAHDARSFVPAAHYLESWGDARAYDGTLSVIQPLVQPLHGGKSTVEVLAALAGDTTTPLVLLRESWRRSGVAPDDATWDTALRNGFVAATATARVGGGGSTSPNSEPLAFTGTRASSLHSTQPPAAGTGLVDVVFRGDARVYDGTFSDNGWLQELPDPVTKLTWDNAALISPATASRINVNSGDVVELRSRDSTGSTTASLKIPALIVPGLADHTVSLQFGYGRTGAEEVGRDIGVDIYTFWPSVDSYVVADVLMTRDPDGAHHDFAITQKHWTMDGRDQIHSQTLDEYRHAPDEVATVSPRPLTIYEPVPKPPSQHQWAMTIDIGICTGCSGCVLACQAENNIPVVGRDDVAKSREMHWLRIDRYQQGSDADPEILTQPMLCQQCENAPCEYVCPVGATDHSPEGLNEMVYNRCVGTRFCSNNCPYKVRRFNWFNYNAELSETERMAKNPDVTVRERGVMEKCTFCVQRIRESEISAERAGRPLRGDEVKTACQQACPTNAIVFGSLTEPDSEMMRRRAEPRLYGVLEKLGTQPRVRYLGRIRNPNPVLEKRA